MYLTADIQYLSKWCKYGNSTAIKAGPCSNWTHPPWQQQFPVCPNLMPSPGTDTIPHAGGDKLKVKRSILTFLETAARGPPEKDGRTQRDTPHPSWNMWGFFLYKATAISKHGPCPIAAEYLGVCSKTHWTEHFCSHSTTVHHPALSAGNLTCCGCSESGNQNVWKAVALKV